MSRRGYPEPQGSSSHRGVWKEFSFELVAMYARLRDITGADFFDGCVSVRDNLRVQIHFRTLSIGLACCLIFPAAG
jgi:hypothetical protein